MFKKVLIANRGEIALRILRACREMGIGTVAVYSEADTASPHVRFADQAVCIGPPEATQSYLHISRLLSAADITKVDAVHPGYGFLAEDPHFAEVCRACGLTFIGPSSEAIAAMGDKARARNVAAENGLPILSGSEDSLTTVEGASQEAEKMGYPVILKASAGGGGRGMRIVSSAEELPQAFALAQTEAGAAFGDPTLYLERYLPVARHIEIQIAADQQGETIHLGERECSLQRRHQKLLEESPSPALTEQLREEMGQAAVRLAKAIGYTTVGTVEFLLDDTGNFYFIEMNTRIQVEHPVTEMVTGLDLVTMQIRLAAGEPLTLRQSGISFTGHSIECRINAEDPETFTPSPGTVTAWRLPGGRGVRVDTHIAHGDVIPPFYDSLLAKLVVHAHDREAARRRMLCALQEFVIEGPKTTIPLHQKLLTHPSFIEGRTTTQFVESLLASSVPHA